VPFPAPTAEPTPQPTPEPSFYPSHLPTYQPSALPTVEPTGKNNGHQGGSPLPDCLNMCEGAFANLTGEFEWSAAGVLTELRAVVVTLEANFNMMALDKHFGLVEAAVAAKLAPLEAEAEALAADHNAKLAKLNALAAAINYKAAREEHRRLASADAAPAPRESTWEKASAPLRIELTTLGTTLAFVAGMVLANLAHGKGFGLRRRSYGQATRATPEAAEASGLAGGLSAQYGAFE
jgi:hypothetical protein